MPNVSDNAASEAEILSRAHRILDELGDETVFSSYGEFRLHASAFFVATLQLRLGRKFPDVNRSPISFDDHCFNAQVFIDAVQHHLHKALTGVTPELICDGDYQAVLKCIEVIESLRNHTSAFSNTDLSAADEAVLINEDEDILQPWNRFMTMLKLPMLSSWKDLQENASSVVTLIVEAVLHKRLKGVTRRPLLKRDYLTNARIAIKAVCKCIGSKLDSAALAEKVVSGNGTALSLIPRLISLAQDHLTAAASNSDNDDKEHPDNVQLSDVVVYPPSSDSPRDAITDRQHMVLKQLKAMNAKMQAEADAAKQSSLRSSPRRHRQEQIWTSRLEKDLSRDEVTLRKLRNETFRHQIFKIFRQTSKLERNYQRVQQAAFKDRRKQLEAEWNNKKISIERFFSDKYEMLMTEIQNATARRKSDETQARVAFRKMENELKTERQKRLQLLKEQLLEKDRNTAYLEPEKILDWLLKIPVN